MKLVQWVLIGHFSLIAWGCETSPPQETPQTHTKYEDTERPKTEGRVISETEFSQMGATIAAHLAEVNESQRLEIIEDPNIHFKLDCTQKCRIENKGKKK